MLLFGLGAAVLLIIGFIFLLIGANKASKDEDSQGDHNFQYAFITMIFSVVLSIVGAALSTAAPSFAKAMTSVSSVGEIISTYFILYGISSFAKKIGNTELAEKSYKMVWAILFLHIFGLVMESIPNFISAGTISGTILIILAILGLVLAVVSYILYLKILVDAKKAFAEA